MVLPSSYILIWVFWFLAMVLNTLSSFSLLLLLETAVIYTYFSIYMALFSPLASLVYLCFTASTSSVLLSILITSSRQTNSPTLIIL